MNIQLIQKHPIVFRVKNSDYEFVKPKFLMPMNHFKLIEAKAKGSTMGWNIEGGFLSTNQLKICVLSAT